MLVKPLIVEIRLLHSLTSPRKPSLQIPSQIPSQISHLHISILSTSFLSASDSERARAKSKSKSKSKSQISWCTRLFTTLSSALRPSLSLLPSNRVTGLEHSGMEYALVEMVNSIKKIDGCRCSSIHAEPDFWLEHSGMEDAPRRQDSAWVNSASVRGVTARGQRVGRSDGF